MAIILSVCMISYNHEDFIEEAILGIINQKTSFPFELVISDDASQDGTNEKILNVTKKLPDHITLKYFHQSPNLGMYPNFEFALNQCQGRYIAICEGDDYWIDTKKLQKQVNFLEHNLEYNLVTGYVKQYSETEERFIEPHYIKSFSFTYKDMLVKNHCSTCTTMIRNFISKENPLQLIPNKGADFQLWMKALGKYKKGMKLEEVIAVYRRHSNSATGVRNEKLNSYTFFVNMVNEKLRIADFWNSYFGNEADKDILKLRVNVYLKLAKVSFERNKYLGFLLYYTFYWKFYILLKLQSIK